MINSIQNKKFVPLLIFALCLSQHAFAVNDQFKSLYDCYSAIGGTPYKGQGYKLNQDFHLVHVQRFSDKSTTSALAPTGIDSFLVFNRDGAQVMNPKFEMSKLGVGYADGRPGESHNQRNYWMTVIAPKESKPIQAGYHIDEQDQSNDTAGWYGSPGWSKEADANYAKHKNDPVKPAPFIEAVTLLRRPIKKNVETDEAEMQSGKTIDRLNFWIRSRYVSTGQGFGTAPNPNGEIDQHRLEYEQKRVATALNNIGACDKIGDATIKGLAARKKTVLVKIQDFLANPNASTKGTEQKPAENDR